MKSNPQDDELLRSYLLGELPEQEADRLERRLLEDDELFELGEALEADLLAACGRGELAPEERERVLRRLASSPQGRERLALACSLNAAVDHLSVAEPEKAPVVPFFRRTVAFPQAGARRVALAAAILLAVIGVFWLALRTFQENGPATRVTQTHEISPPASRPRPAAPERSAPPAASAPAPAPEEPRTEEPDRLARKEEPVAPAHPERHEPVKAVFPLSLAVLRGAEDVEELRVPPGTEIVEIQLDLEGLEDRKSFQATVRSKEAGTVWEKSGLEPRRLDWGTALVLEIPAERLSSGTYEIAVTAGTEELTQKFAVVRENR
ncbi:MAG TPA: hypothetical protein VGG03_27290 [Thermoanaerobaculia bacterium]|jgi:hypothetical protein